MAAISIMAVPLHSQDLSVQLEQALRSHDFRDISERFDAFVDISLEGEAVNAYRAPQAQVRLREFLSGREVVAFNLIHKGKSRNQSTYYIGSMSCRASIGVKEGMEEFRVYMYTRKVKGAELIQKLKFEKK